MQAYATAKRPVSCERLRILDRRSTTSFSQPTMPGEVDQAVIDQLLGRLADLVVDRLMERTAEGTDDQPGEWMDARAAAEYLGIHRDTLRKLAAQRTIPTHQDGPRCKL